MKNFDKSLKKYQRKLEYIDEKTSFDDNNIFKKSFYNVVKYETTFDNKTANLNISFLAKP